MYNTQTTLYEERWESTDEDYDIIATAHDILDRAFTEHDDIQEYVSKSDISVATVSWNKRLGSMNFNVKYPEEHLGRRTPTKRKYKRHGHHTLLLNSKLAEFPEVVEDIVLHELAHLIVKNKYSYAKGHGAEFKREARRLGATGSSRYRMPSEFKSQNYKYTIKCKGCGNETGRTRRSKIVKSPSKYRCGLCSGELYVMAN